MPSRTEHTQRSISATLTEIEAGHRRLGLGAEREDVDDALAIIARIEAKWPALRKRKAPA